MAFIAGKTNRNISNKPPNQYFPEVISLQGLNAIKDQCVPVDPELLEIENYKHFLVKRRQMLTDLVNNFVESILI
jgi:hypothetical protein